MPHDRAESLFGKAARSMGWGQVGHPFEAAYSFVDVFSRAFSISEAPTRRCSASLTKYCRFTQLVAFAASVSNSAACCRNSSNRARRSSMGGDTTMGRLHEPYDHVLGSEHLPCCH